MLSVLKSLLTRLGEDALLTVSFLPLLPFSNGGVGRLPACFAQNAEKLRHYSIMLVYDLLLLH